MKAPHHQISFQSGLFCPPLLIAQLFVHFANGWQAAINTAKVKFAVTTLTDASASEVFFPFPGWKCGT